MSNRNNCRCKRLHQQKHCVCDSLQKLDFFLGPRGLQTSLIRSAVRAADWLINQQDENCTYGEGHVSAFAFQSLRLIGHSVETGAEHLNAEIINADIGSLSGGRVAHYVLGALASCRDPRNFYDFNLVRSLETKLSNYPQVGFNHPFQYSLAVLALCSSGRMKLALGYVKNILLSISEQLPSVHASGDTLAMQIMALTCASKSIKKKKSEAILKRIKDGIKDASTELVIRQLNDSTFGQNEVTAALALQVSERFRSCPLSLYPPSWPSYFSPVTQSISCVMGQRIIWTSLLPCYFSHSVNFQ